MESQKGQQELENVRLKKEVEDLKKSLLETIIATNELADRIIELAEICKNKIRVEK